MVKKSGPKIITLLIIVITNINIRSSTLKLKNREINKTKVITRDPLSVTVGSPAVHPFRYSSNGFADHHLSKFPKHTQNKTQTHKAHTLNESEERKRHNNTTQHNTNSV